MPWSLTCPVPLARLGPSLPKATSQPTPLRPGRAVPPALVVGLHGFLTGCGFFRRRKIQLRAVEWLKLDEVSPLEPDSELAELAELPLELAVMPLNAVYLPSPSQQLMVSEPRYLKLYDDILMNGSRMFAVCHCRGSRLARVGLVFKLVDLKDVTQETNGHTKYVAEHEVRRRVRILEVMNPEDRDSKSAYLRARVEFLEEEKEDAVIPEDLRVILQRTLLLPND